MAKKREKIEVYLVPGFLGFDELVELDYFLSVEAILERKLHRFGLDAKVHATETLPAGSIHKRATKLAQEIAARHSRDASSVHLLGHSTGGLDIRLLLSPGSAVDVGGSSLDSMGEERAANYADALSKVRSAIGLATPHFGAPVADFAVRHSLDTYLGMLRTIADNSTARELIRFALVGASGLAKFVESLPGNWGFLEWISGDVLTGEPDDVLDYLHAVGEDVGALRNLTQAGTDLANALLRDREGVRYGSVITGTNRPAGTIETNDPLLYVNTRVFRLAWEQGASGDPAYPYAGRSVELQSGHDADREAGFDVGELTIDAHTNDGVVPTASQAYGEVLGVFASDHLDCVGHFPHVEPSGARVSGWVSSGADFRSPRFDLMWDRVARFVASSAGVPVDEGVSRRRPSSAAN